ncbi:MAG: monooxygenase [Oceanospirillales bacterium]|uniref:Dimethylsulfoxide oxygenase gamma subunit n=1 Tax=Marinobacterium halophilum TaxID=267374 RepID=A0A2P8ETT4_9GAMM|nr:MmoB/DmpM family protein [Marinobacterium halophilum]MBR9829505.1 monooxygenase [Oceanospirillales bacterium]PSL12864.1 dimethylsulfoxide oxygenase gamma subunit [Marinobacterium halophilum]
MSKVYIALQDNDESRYIVEAIEADNPDVTVLHMPAMIRIEAEGFLAVKRETVEEKIGRDWDVQELHVNLITLGGNVDEDDDQLTLTWNE